MIDKKELYLEIDKICYEILDEIVSPITGIPSGAIWADIFRADLDCYTMGDEKDNKEILEKIGQKYNLRSVSKDKHISPIDDCWPLAQIALYILVQPNNEEISIDKRDL